MKIAVPWGDFPRHGRTKNILSRWYVSAEEGTRIFCDVEAPFCFCFHEGTEILIAVKKILVLISVTGEYVFNQRFGPVHQKGIFITVNLYKGKDGREDCFPVFQTKPFVKSVSREDYMTVKFLHQLIDFLHMLLTVGTAKKGPPGF